MRIPTFALLVLVALSPAIPAHAGDVSQDDIDALERDLARLEAGAERDRLLTLLMEGLAERCFPEDGGRANPIARDEWSRTCLGRAAEVAGEIITRAGHPDLDRALFVSGKANIALKRPAEGRAHLERFVEAFPDAEEAPLAHHSLAELSWEEEDYAAAVPHYRAAADGLPPERAGLPRLRLAWSLHHGGDTAAGIDALVALLGGPAQGEVVETARADLAAMVLSLGDATATLDAMTAVFGEGAPRHVAETAGALLTAGRHGEAAAHFQLLAERHGEHDEAPSWQVGVIDAAWVAGDVDGVAAGVRALLDTFAPGAPRAAAGNHAALQVEEAARSNAGKLHERQRERGEPTPAVIEALYRAYLGRYGGTDRSWDVWMALAALLQEQGRTLEAVDEMLAVVEGLAGRDRGAQIARLAAETLVPMVDDEVEAGPLTAADERVVVLAERFSSLYPRHPDGGNYLLVAGDLLIERGEAERGEALWLRIAERYPAAEAARNASASLVQSRVAAERWDEALALSEELMAHESLVAAHPDLGEVLGRGRATARFNRAHVIWEAGDPAAAAPEFEAVAADGAAAELQTRAQFYAGTCLAEAGDVSRAGVTFRRLYTRFPEDELAPQAREMEANLRWESEDFAAAAALFRALADTFPDHERAPYALHTAAALHDQQGLFDEAIEGYQAYLQRFPDGAEAEGVRERLDELAP